MNCIALFNHEEIGSVSTSGAESSLIPSLLNRLSPTPAAFAQSVARSLLISADMSHGIHPNYTSKHEENPRYFDCALGQTSREVAMSWMNGLFSLIRHPLNDELTIL